jgi:hypothetical protein
MQQVKAAYADEMQQIKYVDFCGCQIVNLCVSVIFFN